MTNALINTDTIILAIHFVLAEATSSDEIPPPKSHPLQACVVKSICGLTYILVSYFFCIPLCRCREILNCLRKLDSFQLREYKRFLEQNVPTYSFIFVSHGLDYWIFKSSAKPCFQLKFDLTYSLVVSNLAYHECLLLTYKYLNIRYGSHRANRQNYQPIWYK